MRQASLSPPSTGISAPVMAADLVAVLEATHTTDAVLVGHSMGGFLALEAVLEVPGARERLGGLVLAASFAGDILDGAPQNRAEAPLLRCHLLPRLTANPTAKIKTDATAPMPPAQRA